jgi:ABC-type proline/glycine betaine transport system permease subunit
MLLVLPLLVTIGLGALGFAVQAGLSSKAGSLFLAVFITWVVLALIAVLILIARLSQRMRS